MFEEITSVCTMQRSIYIATLGDYGGSTESSDELVGYNVTYYLSVFLVQIQFVYVRVDEWVEHYRHVIKAIVYVVVNVHDRTEIRRSGQPHGSLVGAIRCSSSTGDSSLSRLRRRVVARQLPFHVTAGICQQRPSEFSTASSRDEVEM